MDHPTSAFPFRHCQSIQVRFNDFDALGHINNTSYLEYMDYAKIQYINTVLGDAFNMSHQSMVIVNINVSFCQITRFGEPLQVETRVDEIHEHSFVFEQRIVNSDSGDVKVVARVVMVAFDIVDNCKLAISERWRQLISEYESREY